MQVPPVLADDLPLDNLVVSLREQVDFLEHQPGHETWVFGPRILDKKEYLQGLRHFIELAEKVKAPEDRGVFFEKLKAEFEFYEVFGQKDWGQTLITGYYEPVVKGSLKPTKHHSQPLFGRPDDLITLDLSLFDPKYKMERKLRGRVVDKKFIPYYTREEIDTKDVLPSKELVICYVDPIDAYSLHTEGSGFVEMGDGTSLHLTAADKNGHKFIGYSQELVRKAHHRSMTTEQYLRSLSSKEMRAFLNENPSYVFFRKSENHSNTTLGVIATGGRTIATDARYFPKGALGFLVSSSETYPPSQEPKKNVPVISRFVLDQDTGGKILGGGRVDLFFGTGTEAKKKADVTKQWGILYYLVPKVETAQSKANPSK